MHVAFGRSAAGQDEVIGADSLAASSWAARWGRRANVHHVTSSLSTASLLVVQRKRKCPVWSWMNVSSSSHSSRLQARWMGGAAPG